MHFGHHYNGEEAVSYPHGYNVFGEEGHFLAGHVKRNPNTLYGAGLLALDKRTHANLERLRQKLVQLDPCYAFGLEHWPSGNHKRNVEGGVWDLGDLSRRAQLPLEEPKSIFTTGDKAAEWKRPKAEKESEKKSGSEWTHHFCYLCTTLEEHQRHLARRGLRLKEKKKPRPRVQYIPPPPNVRRKKEPEEEKAEVMYKVILRTAKKPDAGTSAQVHLEIHGRKKSLRRRPLTRKRNGRFCFNSGSEETFHFRAPDVGDIRYITIDHDGTEKAHSWLLEDVEILVASSEGARTWLFPCGRWISPDPANSSAKMELRGKLKEVVETEYEVLVVTGSESQAGTDANVLLTIYGKRGPSNRFHLKRKDGQRAFRRESEDVFHVVTGDIGLVSSIKIEHDNSGQNPSWWLEKLVLRESGTGNHGQPLRYDVKVRTGKQNYAGTDARVFLKMFGKLGTTNEVELENGKDCFEKGHTDSFQIKAEDVGDLKKIVVRHDNSGLAAGWYLEEVTIKRYFPKTEIMERLKEMDANMDEKLMKYATEAGLDPESSPQRRKKSLTYKGSQRRRHSGDSDCDRLRNESSDEDSRKGRVKDRKKKSWTDVHHVSDSTGEEEVRKTSERYGGRKKKRSQWREHSASEESDEEEVACRRHQRGGRASESADESSQERSESGRSLKAAINESESDEVSTMWDHGKRPSYDEYIFVCEQWLAEDEGDGQISRTLKPTSITTFYKMQ